MSTEKNTNGDEKMARSTYLTHDRKNTKFEMTEFPSYKELEKNCYQGSGTTWAVYKGYTIEEAVKFLNKFNRSKFIIISIKKSGKKRIAKGKIKKNIEK